MQIINKATVELFFAKLFRVTYFTTFQLPHVIVNCIECYSEALLYQEVLKGLSSDDDYTKCDGPNTFIQKFKTAFQNNYDNKTFYVVSVTFFLRFCFNHLINIHYNMYDQIVLFKTVGIVFNADLQFMAHLKILF